MSARPKLTDAELARLYPDVAGMTDNEMRATVGNPAETLRSALHQIRTAYDRGRTVPQLASIAEGALNLLLAEPGATVGPEPRPSAMEMLQTSLDDVTRLERENDRLRAALRPFAEAFADLSTVGGDTLVRPPFKVQAFKNAQKALQ